VIDGAGSGDIDESRKKGSVLERERKRAGDDSAPGSHKPQSLQFVMHCVHLCVNEDFIIIQPRQSLSKNAIEKREPRR
jgi:hypothetical protein